MTKRIIDRDAFLHVAGLLIPEGPGAPSAGQVLQHFELVDRALAARPDLAPLVNAAVTRGREVTSVPELARILDFPSAEFDALTVIVAGAYYLAPSVLNTLDYDPPAERYMSGSLEDEILALLPTVQCTPRKVP